MRHHARANQLGWIVAIRVPCPGPADRDFVARSCVRSMVETAGGVSEVRGREPAPRTVDGARRRVMKLRHTAEMNTDKPRRSYAVIN